MTLCILTLGVHKMCWNDCRNTAFTLKLQLRSQISSHEAVLLYHMLSLCCNFMEKMHTGCLIDCWEIFRNLLSWETPPKYWAIDGMCVSWFPEEAASDVCGQSFGIWNWVKSQGFWEPTQQKHQSQWKSTLCNKVAFNPADYYIY